MLKLSSLGKLVYNTTHELTKDEMVAFISIAINKYTDKIKPQIIQSLKEKALIKGE